jgi:hypothetical protein
MGYNRSGKRRTEKQKRTKKDLRRILLKQAAQGAETKEAPKAK